MKHINILSTSLVILISLTISGCWTHPSPKPEENIKPIVFHQVAKKKKYIPEQTLYFEHNSYTLSQTVTNKLDSLLELLAEDTNIKIVITGHASEKGSDHYNMTLSSSRATSVANYLLAGDFSKNSILKINAKGKEAPICDNQTTECHKLNRRVEIKTISGTSNNALNVTDGDVKMLRYSKSDEQIKDELLHLHNNKHISYTIGSGDRFNIYVYGEKELNLENGVVKPDGTFTVSMIGDVKISGLTINQAMKKISSSLEKYMIQPIVTLVPSEFRSQNYTILGKVLKPGNYPVEENSKLLDAIADAAGLSIGIFKDNTIELADLEHAFIRRGTDVLPVNFVELVRKGNPLHNIPLQDKDYIYIPSALNAEVYILGEVSIPGYYGYKEHMTLAQLITYAEGFTDSANIEEVAIIRGRLDDPSVYIINLEDILEGKSIDFFLKPYDMIYISKTKLGDWNTVMTMIVPSLNMLTTGFITQQLITGGP